MSAALRCQRLKQPLSMLAHMSSRNIVSTATAQQCLRKLQPQHLQSQPLQQQQQQHRAMTNRPQYSGDTISETAASPTGASSPNVSNSTPSTTATNHNKNSSSSSSHNSIRNNSSNSGSVLSSEVDKFGAMAADWWDPRGSVGPLHTMNPVRVKYIVDMILQHHHQPSYNNRNNNNSDSSSKYSAHQPLAGLRILDVGCGGGLLCEALARLGATVHGIDATAPSIRVAQQHAATDHSINTKIRYECVTAEELAFERNASYDCVCALEIVEHVNNPSAFIDTIKHLVKPTGAMFISTINKTAKSYVLAILAAEYVLRLVALGTHSWSMFIEPDRLKTYITAPLSTAAAAAAKGSNNSSSNTRVGPFSVVDAKGFHYNPLTGNWWLVDHDMDVNYIMYAKRAAE